MCIIAIKVFNDNTYFLDSNWNFFFSSNLLNLSFADPSSSCPTMQEKDGLVYSNFIDYKAKLKTPMTSTRTSTTGFKYPCILCMVFGQFWELWRWCLACLVVQVQTEELLSFQPVSMHVTPLHVSTWMHRLSIGTHHFMCMLLIIHFFLSYSNLDF